MFLWLRVLTAVVFFCAAWRCSGAWACESCVIPQLGRDTRTVNQENKDGRWFVKYLFEQQDWEKISAGDAHSLHHQGHHVHVKTTEDFHHLSLGQAFSERVHLLLNIPYVVRRSLEIHSHARLGKEETSSGLGDGILTIEYALEGNCPLPVSVFSGIKFPSGKQSERNSGGDKFEPELQPGTGSFDYIFGVIGRKADDRSSLVINGVYVLKTEGGQQYTFGDLFSSSVLYSRALNPQARILKTDVGLDVNAQYEQKHADQGHAVKDSGGVTLLAGPVISCRLRPDTLLTGAISFPVYQDLGGVHQELDYVWTASAKVNW